MPNYPINLRGNEPRKRVINNFMPTRSKPPEYKENEEIKIERMY